MRDDVSDPRLWQQQRAMPVPSLRALPVRLQRMGAHDFWHRYATQRASFHTFWGVYAFATPGLTLGIGGVEHPLPTDRLVVIPPFLPFLHPWSVSAGHAYIHVELGGLPSALVRRAFPGLVTIDDPELWRRYCRLMGRMVLGRIDPLVQAQEAVAVAGLALSGAIAQLPDGDRQRLADPRGGWSAVEPAVRFIEAHLDRPIALDDLARVLRCGSQHVVRLFNRHLGQSPMQYVIEQRVLRAAKLLLERDDDLPAIATACGFPNRAYLSRRFERIMGMGPAAYRARYA
jgi:AraC-like DNA-binding protein